MLYHRKATNISYYLLIFLLNFTLYSFIRLVHYIITR